MKAQELSAQISRLTIDIPTELHRVIKAHATLESHSIKEYVLDALEQKLKNKNKSKTGAANISEVNLKKTLSKKTAAILAGANKAKKVSFKDANSAMKYLAK
jgi:hypothetical protein